MYEEHEVFQKPEDEHIKIWRYMDFTKLVSLLDKNALFFSRADKLQDRFEGSYPTRIIEALKALALQRKERFRRNLPTFTYELFRKCVMINSWHMSEHESAAMWKLYLKSNEGVAIQSNFINLAKSFDIYKEEPVFIGKVKYISYETGEFPVNNLLHAFIHKRRSFEHEHELRAIMCRFSNLHVSKEELEEGTYVPIDLKTLVENVFVSPTSKEWFHKLVGSTMKKFGFDKDPIHSSLSKDPLF